MNLWPFSRKPKRAQVVLMASSQMRLQDWCTSPQLVGSAQRILRMPEVQTMLAILRNESPAAYGLSMGASHDDHVAHAYKVEGYFLALNTLEKMGEYTRVKGALEATFEPEKPHTSGETIFADDVTPVNRL